MYIIRERPHAGIRPIIEELEKAGEESEGGLLGLPETETEVDVSLFYYSTVWHCFYHLKLSDVILL